MEVIVSVTPIRSKVWFELDGGEKHWLPRKAAQETGWKIGDLVAPEDFRRRVLLAQYPHGLNLAIAMLARRPCSRGEIAAKLKSARYMDETAEMVLYKLEREKLLNDRDFALQWARSRLNRKYGAYRIQQELRQKGVSGEDLEVAMESLDEEELLTQAITLARKGLARGKPGEDPRKTRQRVLASIVRRGFSWDLARQACSQVLSEQDADEEDEEDKVGPDWD